MSWPDDNLPRFHVKTVTGFLIDPRSHRDGGGKRVPPVHAYVYDRAYCHQIVAAFEVKGGNRFTQSRDAIAQAKAYAAILNQRDERAAA